MKSLHIEVNESIFEKVMLFLSTLPKKDLKIKVEEKVTKKLNAISIDTKQYKFNREDLHER